MKRVEIFLEDTRFKLERKLEELINRPGVRLISMSLSTYAWNYCALVYYEEGEDGNL